METLIKNWRRLTVDTEIATVYRKWRERRQQCDSIERQRSRRLTRADGDTWRIGRSRLLSVARCRTLSTLSGACESNGGWSCRINM